MGKLFEIICIVSLFSPLLMKLFFCERVFEGLLRKKLSGEINKMATFCPDFQVSNFKA